MLWFASTGVGAKAVDGRGGAEREGGFVCGGDDWSYWSLSVFYGVVVYVMENHGACGYGDGVGVCGVGSCFGCFCMTN